MKEEYANNLGDDDHLIAVQDRAPTGVEGGERDLTNG